MHDITCNLKFMPFYALSKFTFTSGWNAQGEGESEDGEIEKEIGRQRGRKKEREYKEKWWKRE